MKTNDRNPVDALKDYLNSLAFEPSGPQPLLYTACEYAAGCVTPEVGAKIIQDHLHKIGIDVAGTNPEEMIERYVLGKRDFLVLDRLNFERFCRHAEMEEYKAKELLEADFRWLQRKSPVDPTEVYEEDYLRALFEPDERIVLLRGPKTMKGQIWALSGEHGESHPFPEERGYSWFWPYPLLGDPFIQREVETVPKGRASAKVAKKKGKHHETPRKARTKLFWSPSAIAKWRYASAFLNVDASRPLLESLLGLQLPIVSLFATAGCNLEVLLRVDAENSDEWKSRCREFRTELGTIRLSCASFRFNWVARLPLRKYLFQSAAFAGKSGKWIGHDHLLYFAGPTNGLAVPSSGGESGENEKCDA